VGVIRTPATPAVLKSYGKILHPHRQIPRGQEPNHGSSGRDAWTPTPPPTWRWARPAPAHALLDFQTRTAEVRAQQRMVARPGSGQVIELAGHRHGGGRCWQRGVRNRLSSGTPISCTSSSTAAAGLRSVGGCAPLELGGTDQNSCGDGAAICKRISAATPVRGVAADPAGLMAVQKDAESWATRGASVTTRSRLFEGWRNARCGGG